MPALNENRKLAVDADGYLLHFEDWDENIARAMAAREGINELTPGQLAMLTFIRDYYKKYDFFPLARAVCKRVNEQKDCLHEQFINPLIAWKLAGLPHPEEPVISLLEAGQTPT